MLLAARYFWLIVFAAGEHFAGHSQHPVVTDFQHDAASDSRAVDVNFRALAALRNDVFHRIFHQRLQRERRHSDLT